MSSPFATLCGRLMLCALLVFAIAAHPVTAAQDCTCQPCDFDRDGDVDQADFGHLQMCLTGTAVAQTNPACQDAKLAGHVYVDQQDVAIFRSCLAGEQQPYPGSDLPQVAISEFMASNDDGLADEDGDHSDWIEIYDPCEPSVDLTGWFLTDDPDDLQKWAFPSVTLTRGNYLVVFASGKDRRDPAQPLHTNFQLDKGGEYLALVRPDGQTIIHSYAPEFPDQLSDVSFGLAQLSWLPVMKGAQASYHVPTQADASLGTAWADPSFQDSNWPVGPTGLGFSSLPSTFQVTVYRANIGVYDLATAEAIIADPSLQISIATGQVPTVNFWNSDLHGHFMPDQAFPGMDLVTDVDNYVTLTIGTVVIPTAGEWTFCVNSDDGFGLRLTQGTQVFESSYPSGRAAADTMGIFNVTQPGIYSLRLVQFEGYGGSSLELSAAQGYYEAFDQSAFHLVGDVAGGGLGLGGVGWDVQTDLGPVMHETNSSVWIRIPFDLADLSGYAGVKLRIRYVDGFAAYLNGQEVARRNAPTGLAWNSAATAQRTGSPAAVAEEIDLPGCFGLLHTGRNVLAIHGLNDTVADGDFAIVPELVLYGNTLEPQYFVQPTPGQPNKPGMQGFVEPIVFDQEHGFRSAPFNVTLTCPTPGSTIRYTVDGSTPTESTGQVYTGPIAINGTTVLRAAAFRTAFIPSPVATNTYLFVSDIIHQSSQGEAPGPDWPAPGYSLSQRIDYGMDPDVVNDVRYADLMDDALLAIPSICIATDIGNLFGPSIGIYTHADQSGRAWERPCSAELINPDGRPGFQIDAGLRVRGGFSRSGDDPKHGFRLVFRSEYGQGSLEYPLFESEGVGSFKKIDLRCEQNYSWQFGGDPRNTAVREVFCRDTEGAMGEPYTRSRYYHLYLNGVYWGLYQTEERPEADYAASYFGGDDKDYDVLKQGCYATDGDYNAWYRLWQACQAGLASDEAYYQVQGLNVDGTRNPAYEVLVDVDSTIDCALLTYWSGDLDGPISAFGSNIGPNNFTVIRNRNGQSGFKCFKHDCEHTLLWEWEDRTGPAEGGWWPSGSEFWQFSPQSLSQYLSANAEYRVRFGDRVQKFLFNGGAMTQQNNTARFMARANQIQTAIIAESARWGDAWTEPPLNRDDHWWPAINWVVNSYLPVRNGILLDQLKADGLYPTVPAPLFSHYGGQVQPGFGLRMSKPAGATGVIYYTTDGTDPRLRGGAISPSAQVFAESVTNSTLIRAGSTWRYRDTGTEQSGWRTTGFDDSTWPQGPAQLGYGDGDEATTVGYGTDLNNKYATTWFRKSFMVPPDIVCTSLTFRMLCDDGAAVYLNGHTPPVTTVTMPTSWTASTYCNAVADETAWLDYTLDPASLSIGNTNVLAVEVHQCAPASTDISFDLELHATLDSSQPVVINQNTTVKARVYDNGQWSALVEAVYVTQPVSLVINEFMADNKTTIQDPDELGEHPDWIEIYNPNSIPIGMAGMYLSDDAGAPTKFKIASGVSVPAYGRLVFWADDDGTQGNLHTNFSLNKAGERIRLTAADGTTVIDEIVFGTQTSDVSYGRYPDGGPNWGKMVQPTPGLPNGPLQ